MRILKMFSLCAAVALPASAQHVQLNVQVPVPTITFGVPPPLVVVQPGIQVVENYDDEVFYVDRYYWVRRGPHWYRARDHRGGWVVVDGPRVPSTLVHMSPGQYRRYQRGRAVEVDHRGPGKMKIKHGKGKWKD